MNLNVVCLTGRLTRDPEVRQTPSGTSVCDLGIAVNSREKVADEWQDRADFVDVTVWGKTAENVGQYLSKGREVAISGRLRLDRWETEEGAKRSKLKVVANSVEFLGGRDDGPAETDVPADTAGMAEGKSQQADDDIPF